MDDILNCLVLDQALGKRYNKHAFYVRTREDQINRMN